MLVFANKQDLPNAMSAAELTDKLGLHNLRSRQVIGTLSFVSFISQCEGNEELVTFVDFTYKFFQWYIQATCATQGHGLYEGLDWLANQLSKS